MLLVVLNYIVSNSLTEYIQIYYMNETKTKLWRQLLRHAWKKKLTKNV